MYIFSHQFLKYGFSVFLRLSCWGGISLATLLDKFFLEQILPIFGLTIFIIAPTIHMTFIWKTFNDCTAVISSSTYLLKFHLFKFAWSSDNIETFCTKNVETLMQWKGRRNKTETEADRGAHLDTPFLCP